MVSRARKRRAVAAVEGEQLVRQMIAQRMDGAPADMRARPAAAQALAFDAQIGDLVERIDGAQAGIELQAVDDGDLVVEPDVLGAQVAVAVDDCARAHAAGDQLAARAKKAALRAVDAPHQPGRQAEPRIEQHALVVGEAFVPVVQQRRLRDENRAGAPVEGDQRVDHVVELRGVQRCRLRWRVRASGSRRAAASPPASRPLSPSPPSRSPCGVRVSGATVS